MRIIRNTFFLYVSLIGGFVLNFIQLKILCSVMTPDILGKFFTVSSFGQILSGILLLGVPFLLVRFLPKFYAQGNQKNMSSLLTFSMVLYVIVSLAVYAFLYFFGSKLGMVVYKDIIISKYLAFGFLVFFVVTYFSIIFTTFNGLRKMHYSAGLNLLYLSILTFLLFVFQKKLTIFLVLKIYVLSVLPSIIIGVVLLRREFGSMQWFNRKLFKEIASYWKYAIGIGFLFPLFFHLDKLTIAYFLTSNFVALFAVASKINLWARTILSIPLEALVPEISYSWEKDAKEVLGKGLGLVIKVLFLLGAALATTILIGGRNIILMLSTPEYLRMFLPLTILAFSLPLMSLYTPITTAMRATGKIVFYLISDITWIASYFILMVLFIQRFQLTGVAFAFLGATVITLIFNWTYVLRHRTFLEIDASFCKVAIFTVLFGAVIYSIFNLFTLPPLLGFLIMTLCILGGYGVFIFKGRIFSDWEKERLQILFSKRLGFLSHILS